MNTPPPPARRGLGLHLVREEGSAVNVQHTLCPSPPARVLAWLLALLLATLTLASAQAQAPPATPDAVTLTRADGTVTADWPAVAGATRYHVAYSTDGGASWHAPVDDSANVPTNRLTFSADNGKTYVVGVRAGNDDGWGDWTNSAPAGPYQQQPPAAVGSVNVTRTDGTVSANWNASDGAERYHVTYTTDNGASWSLAALEHQETSIAINNADNGKTYVVGVRAGNDDGWSGWRNSAAAGPYAPPAPPAITAIRGDGGDSATVSWTPYGGSDFQSYRVIVCDDSQYDGSSCSGTVFQSDAIYDVKATGPMTVTGLDVGTGYGVILQVWRDGGTLKVHATLPALVTPPAAPSGLSATVGDESITLTWDDPSDSGITGYEYNVNHNDTSTGNFSGWGPWQSIAGSGTGSVSHVIDGLTNGKEYRYRLRAVNAGGAGGVAPTAHPWYVSATPQGSPSAPTGITVSVDLNVMTVGWNAVPGADGYDVRTKTGSADWVVVASNVTGTTADITILEMPDYTGVRARAGNAASAWTDVSRLPPPDIFDPPPGGMGAQAQALGGQAQNTLAAPTNVSVERLNGSGDDRIDLYDDESLIVKWDAVTGATGYRIACNYFEGDWNWHRSWRKCGKDGSNWKTYGTSAGTNGVTVNYIDGLVDSNTGSWMRIYIASSHSVIVQAVKDGTPGNWSAPFDTYPAYPIYLVQGEGVPPKYQRLDASSRTATGFTLAWTHPYRAAGHVAECVETVNGDPSGSWKKCSEDTNVFSEKMVDGKAVTTAQAHLYGLTINDRIVTGVTIDDLDLATAGKQSFDSWKSYDVRVSTLNPSGQSAHTYPSASLLEPYHNLAASNVTSTGATLSITNYAYGWWYKRTSPSGDSTCHAVSASPYTASLSSLTPGMPYTYKMYDQSGCNDADEKDSVSFTTPGLVADSLTPTDATLTLTGHTGNWWLKQTSPSTGTCTAGAADFSHALSTLTAGTSYTYTAYRDSSCTTLIATVTFTPAHSPGERDAAKDFDTFAAAGNTSPRGLWSDGTTLWVTDRDDKKLYAYKRSDMSRDSAKDFNTLDAAGNDNPSGIWSDGTTMWVADRDDDKLYAYKRSDMSRDSAKDFNTLSAAGNQDPYLLWSDGTTLWVGDFVDGKLYAYKMSDRSRDAAKDFNTLDAAGNDRPTGLWSDGTTLWVGDWDDDKVYAYKMSDRSRDAAKDFDTLHAAGNYHGTGLWSDGTTLWVADMGNAKLYAYQGQPRLSASSVTAATATLTLANHTGNWYYKADSGPDSTCKGPVSGASQALSGLTGGTTYTYTAYSKSGCNSADELVTATFTTLVLSKGRDAAKDFNTLDAAGNDNPVGLWSNGTTMWVANDTDAKLYAYKMSDKSRDAAKDFNTLSAAGNGNPHGLWSDGATMWVSDYTDDILYAYKMSDRSRDAAKDFDTLSAAGNNVPQGLWSDGTTMWVVDYTDGKIYAYKMSDKSRDAAKDFNTLDAAGNDNPTYIWSNGTTTWVADWTDGKIYAYKMSDKSRDAAKDFDTLSAAGNGAPHGLWSNGATMWVADYTDNKIYAYQMLPGLSASSVIGTTATLTLVRYTGNWWLKQTSPSTGTCTAGEADFSHALSTLTADTTYTYTAYSNNSCATVIDTATFTTPPSPKQRYAAKDFDTLSAAGNHSPSGLWSNGTTMWVVDYTDAKIYAYKMSDGSRDAAKDFDTLAGNGNGNPHGLWSNGTTMWVSDWTDDILYAYKMSDKSRDAVKNFDSLSAAGNRGPQGLWSDGTTMWVTDATDGKLYAYKMSDRSRDAAKDFNTLKAAGNDSPTYIWSDGTTMWVADYTDAKLYAYKMSDKSRDAAKDFDTLSAAGNGHPHGLWSNGITMWVADYVDDKIYAYKMLPRLSASSVTATTATLTLANRTGNWYYKADRAPHTTCSLAQTTASASLASLTANTSYTYTAYSKTGCGVADALTSVTFSTPSTGSTSLSNSAAGEATPATGPYTAGTAGGAAQPQGRGQAFRGGDGINTPAAVPGRSAGNAADASAAPPTGYVSNLASARSGDSDIDAGQRQAVAFTTGPNLGGYVLKSFTAALRKVNGAGGRLVLTLHEMASDAYGPDSHPAATVLATLAGSAPASGAFTDVTYTCSGSGCRLDPDTTYFVVAEAVGAGAYAWAYVAAAHLYTEITEPEGSGWTLGAGHYADDNGDWTSWDDWHHARIDFEAPPSPVVTVSNLDRPVHDDACFPSGDVACAVGFTTGSDPDGYTLDAVTARFAAADDPDGLLGDIAVTLHADGGGVPGALLATLSGDNPRASGDYAYVCFGLESCVLSPNTTYFVQITAAAGEYLSEAYEWAATLSDHETQSPAGNGWRLADGTDGYESAWVEYRDVGLLRVFAVINPPMAKADRSR